MTKNMKKNFIIAAAIVLILIIGSVSAYFTSSDKA